MKKENISITKNRYNFSDGKIKLLLFIITFVISTIMGSLLNVACILDETGVVANAAYVAGYNWNTWVTATGGYFYKYGSALLYIPIMKCFDNPFIIYKLIMMVNSVMIAIIPVCAYHVLRKHLSVADKSICAITSFVVGIVPASVLYSLSAKADVALISISWVLLICILEVLVADTPKKQYIYSILIAVVSVYIYMCHTRGIVFVIAAFMTVFTIRYILKERSVKFLPYLATLIVFLMIDKKLTSFFKHAIWGTGKMKNTMERFSFGKYRKIFTFTGIETLVKNTSSWLFDSIIGTYGFLILGVVFAFCVVVLYFKKKDISKREFVLSLYGALVFLGTAALGLLFFFSANFKLMAGYSTSRVDRMFYSRYMSPVYAILVLIAIYYLFIKTDRFTWKSKLFSVVFSYTLILFVHSWLYDLTQKCGFSWRNTLDCGMFYKPEYFGKDAGNYVGNGTADALVIGAILGFVVFVVFIVLSCKNIKNQKLVIGLIGLCFMVNIVYNYVVLRFNADMRTMNICGPVFAEIEGIVDRYPEVAEEFNDLYYDQKESSGYKFYQMGLPNFDVHVRDSVVYEEIENAFIVVRNNVFDERWVGEDCYLLKEYDYENNINAIIVKGDKLKNALEEHGIVVYELPDNYGEKKKISVSSDYWKAVKKSFQSQKESFSN